jgi:hypothetical protein
MYGREWTGATSGPKSRVTMRLHSLAILAFCLPLAAATVGCSSVGSSAVRTDGAIPRANVGGVRVYGVTQPANTRVIGVVEVHAIQDEANLETLMPVFVQRVAQLGGTGGVIDNVLTGYEWRTEMRMESYSYPCGFRHTCFSSRMMPYTYEVRFLTIQGRAIVPQGAPAPGAPQPFPKPPAPNPPQPAMETKT